MTHRPRRPAVAPDPDALGRSEHDSLSVAPGRRRAKHRKVTLWRFLFGWGRRKRHPHDR